MEPARQQQLRTLAGIPPQARVIGTVARLVASKGVDQLIHSLALIRPAMPDAHLLIVGDGEERGRLQELAGTSPATRAHQTAPEEVPDTHEMSVLRPSGR